MAERKVGNGSDLNFGMNINPEFHFVDEQSNYGIVHQLILWKAEGFTRQTLDPRPQIEVFSLDFLGITLANCVLVSVGNNGIGRVVSRVPQQALVAFFADKRPLLIQFRLPDGFQPNFQATDTFRCPCVKFWIYRGNPSRFFFKVLITVVLLMPRTRAVSRIPLLCAPSQPPVLSSRTGRLCSGKSAWSS